MTSLRPKKSLGQHFLNSSHVLDQIISAANVKKGELVLEIGPGTGILTSALLEVGANVLAIEKDSRANELLKVKFIISSELSAGKSITLKHDKSINSFARTVLQSPVI